MLAVVSTAVALLCMCGLPMAALVHASTGTLELVSTQLCTATLVLQLGTCVHLVLMDAVMIVFVLLGSGNATCRWSATNDFCEHFLKCNAQPGTWHNLNKFDWTARIAYEDATNACATGTCWTGCAHHTVCSVSCLRYSVAAMQQQMHLLQ